MKKTIALILVFVLILCISGFAVYAEGGNMIIISLDENEETISGNPGKGWVRYSTISSGLSDEVLNLISTGYSRFNWAEIEPKEGEFNWLLIDSALDSWASVGKKFAFGIMGVNTASTDDYITPKWVFDAGAKYTRMTSSASADGLTAASGQYIPVWDDGIYLEKVNHLAKALAERYDGDRRIAFIDIRSYGNYGETHLMRLESSGSKALGFEGEKKHIDAYTNNFKKTKLIYPTANKSTHNDITRYATEHGVGLRYDGIMQDSTDGVLLKPAKDKNTAIFEFALPYSNLKSNKSGGNRSWNEAAYIAAFNRALPSYMDLGQYNDDSELFYKDNKKLVRKITNIMGYHFVIKNFKLNTTFSAGNKFDFAVDIENKGITRLFEPGYAAISILDGNNNLFDRVWLDNIHLSDADAGEITSFSESVSFNDIPDGTYKLVFGMFCDKEDAYPAYKFGNYGSDGMNYYQIAALKKEGSAFKVEDPYVHINGKTYVTQTRDGKVYLPLRSCFEGIGANVGWNEEVGVTASFDGNIINLRNNQVYLNGSSYSIGNGYINNGVSYIEMKIFGEIGGFNYKIDDKTRAYIINTVKYELENMDAAGTIIKDGDFEANTNAWSFNSFDFEYSEDNSFSGKTALKVNNNRKLASAYQSFTVQAGNEYEINFSLNDAASVGYSISDGNEDVLYSGIVPKGEGQWKDYSFKFGYDYNALNGSDITTKISFISYQDDSDCSYVDNVSVKLLGEIEEDNNGLFGDNGVETNRTKWLGRNGASFARTSENPHSGDLCGVINNRAGTWYGGMIDIYDTLQENGPGRYKFDGWFRTAPGDGEMGITVYSFKLNGAIDITEVFRISEEWTHVTFESEITQNQYDNLYSAYTLIMGDPGDGDNNITKDIYFDDIYMTKVSD